MVEMQFRRGDLVEVASLQEGFRGSYFEAIVARVLARANKYIVEYETLVTENFSAPLCEKATAAEVRPRPPPRVRRRDGEDFKVGDLVDAYDNEGWWTGEITGKVGDELSVYFDSSNEELEYSVDELRIHLDWDHITAEWIDPMGRSLLFF